MAKIKEDEILAEDLEIGGLQRLDIEAITEERKYLVRNFEVLPTKWGSRVDFTISDDFQEWTLSSWNIATKKKFKPSEIVGKEIKLNPYNEKKILMSF